MSIIKAILGVCETRSLSSNFWNIEEGNVRVSISQMHDILHKGEAVHLKGKGLAKSVLLYRTEDDHYLAFANCCTHIGHRRLDPVPGQSKLRCCSVNHSTFDLEGRPLSGPAKKPLTRHVVEKRGEDILIRLKNKP
jgi:nitrite reductase/ring-hydroxylating ferredoxin subunit